MLDIDTCVSMTGSYQYTPAPIRDQFLVAAYNHLYILFLYRITKGIVVLHDLIQYENTLRFNGQGNITSHL